MHLPWVCHAKACFRLVTKLLPNCFLLLVRCSSQFALSFLFWTYFSDNSNVMFSIVATLVKNISSSGITDFGGIQISSVNSLHDT
jgi:hypothetical protein